MNKEYLVKRFPIIRKVRKMQINMCFFGKMYLDKNKYSKKILDKKLPYEIKRFKDRMVNKSTGFDIEYQYNKVFNLKLASKKLNNLLIKPGETFSLYFSIKNADKKEKYKKGLIVVKGKMEFVEGGGMCQMSNLLFEVFLNSPLTIVERHTHKLKDFPDSREDELKGIDATIAEGFLDLKVRNDTDNEYQISIDFDDEYIYAWLLSKNKIETEYKIINKNLKYIKEDNKIFEEVDVYRQEIKDDNIIKEEKLYSNRTEIGYELPVETSFEVKK